MAEVVVDRPTVLRFRFRRQGLDVGPEEARGAADLALLDFGVQDTGPDGAQWALATRGASREVLDELSFAWTLRGAPHAYRRRDLPAVVVATAPLSEDDAAKRIFDASKPLRAVGIATLEALRTLAGHMRDIVAEPTAKGEVSRRLTDLVGEPYLRTCRPCQAIHVYENPFRLAALQAGLELEPDTSPPVMRRIPRLRPAMYRRLGDQADPRFDVIRNYLRFYGPARVRDAAEFLDAPAKVVQQHWPEDAAEVEIADEGGGQSSGRRRPRFVLADDLGELARTGAEPVPGARLLGPYDPYVQLRDRDLLVADPARRKELWPVIGRPGAIVGDGEILGTWRPRTSGRRLTVAVEQWTRWTKPVRTQVEQEAERLAAHRDVDLAGVGKG